MVNPYEQSTALPPEPHEPRWRSIVSTPLILASATIWVGLIVCVYFVLPRVRTMLVGFGVAIGPLEIFGMDYAGLLLPHAVEAHVEVCAFLVTPRPYSWIGAYGRAGPRKTFERSCLTRTSARVHQ
jgi:hypothetical protein